MKKTIGEARQYSDTAAEAAKSKKQTLFPHFFILLWLVYLSE